MQSCREVTRERATWSSYLSQAHESTFSPSKVSLLSGRTDNAAKNRYFALLRKQQASAKAPKKADEEGGAGPGAGSKLHDFGLEGHSASQREHPSESRLDRFLSPAFYLDCVSGPY
jgi:hypothetical protein